jgi:hypothetical protein
VGRAIKAYGLRAPDFVPSTYYVLDTCRHDTASSSLNLHCVFPHILNDITKSRSMIFPAPHLPILFGANRMTRAQHSRIPISKETETIPPA